jgi:ABC-2 type transport system permease protein
MWRYLRLTFFFGSVYLRKIIEYRVDFALGFFGLIVQVATRVLLINTIFLHIQNIRGWSYYEVLFLFGFSLIPRSLDHMFADQLWELARKLVQRGEFFKYLLRPLDPLFYLISERFFFADGIGEMTAGLVVTFTAASHLPIRFGMAKMVITLILVGFSALIYTAVKLTFASLAFWTGTSLPSMSTAYNISTFFNYPIEIYDRTVRFLITYVVPFAFAAYFPVRYVLFDDTRAALLTPLVASLFGAVAYRVWQAGLTRYEMTGT